MNLETIMLNERIQTQRATYCIKCPEEAIYRDRKINGCLLLRGLEEWIVVVNGYEGFSEVRKCSKIGCGDGSTSP